MFQIVTVTKNSYLNEIRTNIQRKTPKIVLLRTILITMNLREKFYRTAILIDSSFPSTINRFCRQSYFSICKIPV